MTESAGRACPPERMLPVSNPFATRFIGPDMAEFLIFGDRSPATLLARFEELGGRAAILGPHGVGKSTLLTALARAFADQGRTVARWSLRAETNDPAPWEFRESTAASSSAVIAKNRVLLLDGYEQLSYCARRRVRQQARRAGWQLLVTAHRRTMLPTLIRLTPDVAFAIAVVRHLLRDTEGLVMTKSQSLAGTEPSSASPAAFVARITEGDVRRVFAGRQGDLRETLFELFDLWEQRARTVR